MVGCAFAGSVLYTKEKKGGGRCLGGEELMLRVVARRY
jgi:hypothetical protein